MNVDIKVSHSLDRLIFSPRDMRVGIEVKRLLCKYNPGIQFGKSVEGIWVSSTEVWKLELDIPELKLQWTEFAELFIRNRRRAKMEAPKFIDSIKDIQVGGDLVAKQYLHGIDGLQTLDKHQLVNVACMTLDDGFGLCVFDEQGAGKTVTLIFAFDVLVERNKADFALIIAPKSMISEWPVDFEKFMPGRYKIEVLTGGNTQKRKTLSRNADVIITNFETAITMEQELRSLLRTYESRGVLVVDESFFVKNLEAKRTQAIRRLREYCSRAFVLCGTPAPNSPIDLIQQFNIVDFGLTFDGVDFPKDKAEAADIVHKVIHERGPFIRHLKADVLPDLPKKRFNRINVTLEPKQSELYRKISSNLIRDLEAVDDVGFEANKMSFFARRSALLQICSNPKSIADHYDETPAKILVLDKILEELIGLKNEKVIVWSFYTASIELIVSRYARFKPVRYDGTVSETAIRREGVRLFREDLDVKLFVGNPAAAGAGLNLQSARYAVYESMSNQAAHYLQSLDRIHRRGQKRDVEYIILLCDGTIEVSEYERLIQKEEAAQAMLGDTIVPALTREMMLSELFT